MQPAQRLTSKAWSPGRSPLKYVNVVSWLHFLLPFHRGLHPGTVDDRGFWPISTAIKRKVGIVWCRQPICSLRLRRRNGLHIDGERFVRIRLEILVFSTDRVKIDFVWGEEVMLVIECQWPEAINRRSLFFSKGYAVLARAIKVKSILVEVLIEVLRLFRRVYKDVGLCNRRASEVICSECCFVRNRAPVVRQLPTVIAELEERPLIVAT